MLPTTHISLLIAGEKRAKAWTLGLQKAGFSAEMVETSGSEAAKGDFWVAVPEIQGKPAQEYVTKVLAGEESLPTPAPVGGALLWGAGLIVSAILVLIISVLLF